MSTPNNIFTIFNCLINNWHRWRIDRLTLKLRVQTERCSLLRAAESEYAASYYTDLMIDAECQRVKIVETLAYHKAKLRL